MTQLKKLFVTGGCGFIGSNFIRYTLAKRPGVRIVNFDKLTYAGNLENLSDVESDPRYSFIKGDIADHDAVTAALDGGFDAIVFAAQPNGKHLDCPFPATQIRCSTLCYAALSDVLGSLPTGRL